jgi:hypothetical protein
LGDWRSDSARNTRGFAFTWRTYTKPRDDWDHDHCEGCGVKFAEFDGEDILREGYASDARYKDRPGYYDWVCAKCFADLGDAMGWSQIGYS